jgi:hypothetical protein
MTFEERNPSSFLKQRIIPGKPGMTVLKSNACLSRLPQNSIPFKRVILGSLATHVIHDDP